MKLDPIALAGSKAKGKRPGYFRDTDSDRLMAILMAVAGELAVTRERLDTLERLLEKKGVLNRDAVEEYSPDSDAARERGLWHQEFIARILRVLQQEIEQFDEDRTAKKQAQNSARIKPTTDLDALIEELAEI